METTVENDVVYNAFVRDAKNIIKKGHEGNNKVYKEARMYLQKYADTQNKYCHITVPYWVHLLQPEVLAQMLMMWCKIIDYSKPRGA